MMMDDAALRMRAEAFADEMLSDWPGDLPGKQRTRDVLVSAFSMGYRACEDDLHRPKRGLRGAPW